MDQRSFAYAAAGPGSVGVRFEIIAVGIAVESKTSIQSYRRLAPNTFWNQIFATVPDRTVDTFIDDPVDVGVVTNTVRQ